MHDDLLNDNNRIPKRLHFGSSIPRKRIAIIACMDARIDPPHIFGLEDGDAHVIRNAGAVITEDVIRSIIISQWRMYTREIVILRHTDCGMLALDEEKLQDEIEAEAGIRPPFVMEAFFDLEKDLLGSKQLLSENPFILHRGSIGAYIFDVQTGRLHEVK
jgi:carbonic anhydrase